MKSRRSQSGFTLFELLVASAIFVIIGGSAYVGWYQIHKVGEATKASSERVAELNRTFYWLSEDLEQMVNRPIMNEVGSKLPALEFSLQGIHLIEFTRSGWANPAEDIMPPRGHFQRVAYFQEDDMFVRKYWYHVDRSEEEKSTERQLLSKVGDVSLRFLHKNEWLAQWPPSNADSNFNRMPSSIDITFDLEDLGKINRIFFVPSG